MPINITNIYLNLDTNKPNLKIDERFLQGNADKTLNIKFLKNNEAITITDGIKATLTLVYYNGSNILKKYLISPTLEGGGTNTKYTIPAIANNILTIPFSSDIAFIDHAGKVDLIIKIEDGTSYYTYSCNYNVDTNEAYNPIGIIDNLPSIDNIKTDVSTLKTDMTQAKTDIIANTQSINTKANSNLSNVGDFSTGQDGALLYKKDGQLKHTPIIIDDTGKVINSPYSLSVPPNTINIGENISLKENGGFINFFTKASGKYYIALDYENNAITGTQKPIYYQRGPVQTKVALQSVDNIQMNNVTSINLGNATNDVQVQALYLKLINATTNFKLKLNINGKDVAYYPSKAAWDGNESGFNLSAGLQKIQLDPFWSTITGFNRTFYFKSDTPINLWGNGTLPYVAEDLNTITKKDVALMEDIAGSIIPETGETIKNKLEALNGADRMSAYSLKDLDTISAKLDLSNVSTVDFEKKFLTTDAYNRIAQYMNTSHDAVIAKANEIKPNTNVNLSTTTGSVIFVDYQFTGNTQVIRQQLPPSSQGKYIMFGTIYPNPYTGTQIILSPAANQNINGSPSDIIINRSGFLGIAVPTNDGYIWVQSVSLGSSVEVSEQEGATTYRANKLLFPFATAIINDDGIVTVNTSMIVTDENNQIVQDCNILEVPSTSLISAIQNTGNSNAAVLDFKGIPTDSGDSTPVNNAKYLSFPQALVTQNGDKTVINTAPSVSVDGNYVAGRTEVFEFPSTGGLKAEGIAGTDTVKITSKGFKATRDGQTEIDGVKTLEFPVDGLISGTEDVTNSDQLNVEFSGLPIGKTVGGTLRKATKLLFPQANVFGTDGDDVHVGTGHSVFLGDNEVNAQVNTFTFTDNGTIQIDPDDNNTNNVILTIPPSNGVSVTKTDADVVNQTTTLYFPEAEIEDGSTQGSKIIHTRTAPPQLTTSSDTFTDYNKITLVDNDLSLHEKQGETTTLELGFNGFSVEQGTTEYPNIKILNFDKNEFVVDGSNANIADITLKPKNSVNSGFMAYYTHKDVIEGSNVQAVYRDTSLVPNHVVYENQGIGYNDNSGIITLEYAGTEPMLFKIVARATLRRQVREADINVYMYLENVDNGEKLTDLDSKTEIVHRTIKKELPYDYIEIATMISITETTAFKVVLRDDEPGKYIDILDMVMGTSAIVVEKVESHNQPSQALQYYESLTGQSMKFIKRTFTPNFEDISALISSSPTTVQDYPDDTTFARDGWIIYYQDEGKYSVQDVNSIKCLRMQDMPQGMGYFNICRVLDYEDTKLLQGKDIKATVYRTSQVGEFMLVPIIWKRKINVYPPKIVVGMNDQGLFGTTDGWEVVLASKTVIAPAETELSVTCTYTVPSDAVNVGFMLMPTKQQTSSDISFSTFSIGCDPAFDKWVIETPSQLIDEQMYRDSRYAKFVQTCKTRANMSDWYQWTNGQPTQLYVGELQAGSTADVIKVGDNPAGTFAEIHNAGYLQFLNDGRVSIRTRFMVGTDAFPVDRDHNDCDVYYAKDNGTGLVANSAQVAASVHHVSVPKEGNVWNDGTRTNKYLDWTFTMDVVKDEKYFLVGLGVQMPQDAHFYNYPFNGYIEITFLEEEYKIIKLENLINSLQSQIVFTTNATATNTKLKVDNAADGSTPTVTATTTP